MAEVTMTLEEYEALRRLITSERESEGASLSQSGKDLSGNRKPKRRKKNKKLSKALKMANDKLRNKNGSLKKGKKQSDVMKMAHKLMKKM
jgi:hypothetical protein